MHASHVNIVECLNLRKRMKEKIKQWIVPFNFIIVTKSIRMGLARHVAGTRKQEMHTKMRLGKFKGGEQLGTKV